MTRKRSSVAAFARLKELLLEGTSYTDAATHLYAERLTETLLTYEQIGKMLKTDYWGQLCSPEEHARIRAFATKRNDVQHRMTSLCIKRPPSAKPTPPQAPRESAVPVDESTAGVLGDIGDDACAFPTSMRGHGQVFCGKPCVRKILEQLEIPLKDVPPLVRKQRDRHYCPGHALESVGPAHRHRLAADFAEIGIPTDAK